MQAMQIELQPSKRLRIAVAVMGLLALASIALAELPIEAKLAALVGLLAALFWRVRSGCFFRLPRLRLAADGRIQVAAEDAWIDAEARGGSFVSPGLCVIRLRTAQGKTYRVILLPDSASPEALRRLRVSLRWAPRTRSDTISPDAD